MVLGKDVAGGKVYGEWPGLANDHLYQRADLAVTTDFRQVLAEVAQRRMGISDVAALFPNYSGFRPLGIHKALHA